MCEPDRPPHPLVVALASLTVVSGFVDAVSFLGLGHVFTANMTGNVALVGFAAAGAPRVLRGGQPVCSGRVPLRRGCRGSHRAQDQSATEPAPSW